MLIRQTKYGCQLCKDVFSAGYTKRTDGTSLCKPTATCAGGGASRGTCFWEPDTWAMVVNQLHVSPGLDYMRRRACGPGRQADVFSNRNPRCITAADRRLARSGPGGKQGQLGWGETQGDSGWRVLRLPLENPALGWRPKQERAAMNVGAKDPNSVLPQPGTSSF